LLSSRADRLAAFQAVDWEKALGWLKTKTSADLAPEQADAVKLALTRFSGQAGIAVAVTVP
jgi:exodeoxyribonuclease V alpha subunit